MPRNRLRDLIVQGYEDNSHSPFKELLITSCNVMRSACFVAQLFALQLQSSLKANSSLLWGVTIIAVIIAQPFIIRRAVHEYKAEVKQMARADGVLSLETQIKQLDL